MYFTGFAVSSRDIQKNWSFSEQLVIFRAFFLSCPDPKSEKNLSKSTNKKILALSVFDKSCVFMPRGEMQHVIHQL